jgi:chemotaxis signal transduction protein
MGSCRVEREEARVAALLDRRTTALATRHLRPGTRSGGASPAEAQPVEAMQSLMIWGLGESLFGTDAGAIAAVVPFTGCARVPTREAACLGVIGRAGRFYSVIGMRRLLGQAPGEMRPAHLLLLRGAAPYLALAVDHVLGRLDVAAALAVPAPSWSFEGRLVAPFDVAGLQARLSRSSPAALPVESMPP